MQIKKASHPAPIPVPDPMHLGRADRPRSAAGMGSGFSTRSVMVPDPVFRPRTSRDAGPYLTRLLSANRQPLTANRESFLVCLPLPTPYSLLPYP